MKPTTIATTRAKNSASTLMATPTNRLARLVRAPQRSQ
jgi:hypothetical protein